MKYLDCTIVSGGLGRYVSFLCESDLYDILIGDRDKLQKLYPNKKTIETKVFLDEVMDTLTKDDIVHMPYNTITSLPQIEKSPCKKILTVHDIIPLKVKVLNKKETKKWYMDVKKSIDSVNEVITVSEQSKSDILETFKVDEDKIRVIYSAIAPVFYRLSNEEINQIKEKFGVEDAAFLFMCGGSKIKHKNLVRMLIAFRLAHLPMSVKLIVTRKNSIKFDLLLRILGLIHRVKLVGFVSDKEMTELYNIADVFLFCSLYEGFGLPPLEALKCGTISISSNVSCMPEVLGKSAKLCNPYSVHEISKAIFDVYNDETERDSYLKETGILIEKYTVEKFICGHRKILEQI